MRLAMSCRPSSGLLFSLRARRFQHSGSKMMMNNFKTYHYQPFLKPFLKVAFLWSSGASWAEMKSRLRKLLWVGGTICSLPFLYVLIYMVLSLFGRYGPMVDSSTTHLYVFPYWTFDPHVPISKLQRVGPGGGEKWKIKLFLFYWPLIEFDNDHFHNYHDTYITGYPGSDRQWTYTTNTASILANQK
jgi:hypothetical protein